MNKPSEGTMSKVLAARPVGPWLAAWFAAFSAVASDGARAQEPAAEAASLSEPPAEPDIVVRGRRYGELRLEIRIAEEAFYERFNEINSDDRFDIHCKDEKRYASRMVERRCQSNSWREQDENIAQATLRGMRGEFGAASQQFRAEQLMMQQRLGDEVRRLATQDEELKRALLRLGNAQLALATARGRADDFTLEREVPINNDGTLPFGAERVYQVRIGADPWSHGLLASTFTIGDVTGDIRGLDLDCENDSEQFDYEPDVEWTVPSGWSACILRVRAARDTMFVLYEF